MVNGMFPAPEIQEKHQRDIELETLLGLCENVPQEVFTRIDTLYCHYGFMPALEAAIAVIHMQKMMKQFP